VNATENANGNAVLVNALSSSMRSTMNGMESVPGLVRQVIEEDSWRNFTTPRGEQVTHASFESFVTAKPTKGLGYSVAELMRLVADDTETAHLVANLLGRPVAEFQQAEKNVWNEPAERASGVLPSQDPLWRDPSDDPVALAQSDEPDLDLADPVDRDAFELRSVGRSGSWVWALKVARNIIKSKPGSLSEQDRRERDDLGKVSATEFGRRIGWSTDRVMRYYRAWEKGIERHGLPAFDQLKPGMHVPLPAAKTWAACFVPGRVNSERAESLETAAVEAGLSMGQVVNAAKSPGAMKAAIIADTSTAEAAYSALLERSRSDGNLRATMARTIAHDPVFRKETAVESRKAERAEYVRHVVDTGQVKSAAGQVLDLPKQAKDTASKLLAVVEDPHATSEEVAEAYEAVQGIAAEVVKADPEIQTREQRTRFSKALSSTAKSIEAIDPDDLIAVADDDLREKLAGLQKQVNELAALIVNPTAHLRAV